MSVKKSPAKRKSPVRRKALAFWTEPKAQAALLLAQGESIVRAAAAIKVAIKTVARWKQEPEFRDRLAEHVAEFRERFMRDGLAKKETRISKLTRLYESIEDEVIARAQDFDRRGLKVGLTGMIAETWKQLGSGEDAQLLPEYAVDNPTSREMRGILEQVAKELGQLENKISVEATLTTYDAERLRNLSDDELTHLTNIARKLAVFGESGS